jgi:hypothetical protein
MLCKEKKKNSINLVLQNIKNDFDLKFVVKNLTCFSFWFFGGKNLGMQRSVFMSPDYARLCHT